MPRYAPVPLSRRRFVAATAGVTGLVLAGGCVPLAADRDPDPLLELLEAAERDAREFAAADASHGDLVTDLRGLAETRRVHADRLTALIDRAEAGAETTTGPAEASAAVCPPVEQVRERLRSDARRAAEVTVDTDGPRAELAASVSASCTAAAEVLLT